MKFLKKIRIFKRLREYKTKIILFREENYRLKGQLIGKRKSIEEIKTRLIDLNSKHSILTEKKEKASKHIAKLVVANRELKRRRDESIKRLRSEVPDEVIGGRFENYKYWIAEPFIVEKFTSYNGIQDRELFIDQFAAYRGLNKVLTDEQKREAEDS